MDRRTVSQKDALWAAIGKWSMRLGACLVPEEIM